MLKIQIQDTSNNNTTEREIENLKDIVTLIEVLFIWYEKHKEYLQKIIIENLSQRGIENIETLFGTYDEAQELLRCSEEIEIRNLSDVAEYIEELKDQIEKLQDAMEDIHDIADNYRG